MRGPNEWHIRARSWEVDPAHIDSLRRTGDDNSPDARAERLRARREAVAEEFRLALAGDPERVQTLRPHCARPC